MFLVHDDNILILWVALKFKIDKVNQLLGAYTAWS